MRNDFGYTEIGVLTKILPNIIRCITSKKKCENRKLRLLNIHLEPIMSFVVRNEIFECFKCQAPGN